MLSNSFVVLIVALVIGNSAFGQHQNQQMVRLAKLVIDSTQLEQYNAFLKEEIETSFKENPEY